MQSYSVSIVSGSFERRKNNSGLLHGFTGFLLVLKTMDWTHYIPPEKKWLPFLFLAAGVLFVTFGLTGKRISAFNQWSKLFFILESLCFLVLTFVFISVGKPIDLLFTISWTILCIFFYYTENRMERPVMVTLKNEGVVIPGIVADKLIAWKEVEQVILRNDYLTISKKNNKYFQFEVAQEDGESFREAFNRYALSRTE